MDEKQGTIFPPDAFCIFRDGDQWCATRLDFTNLQESPAGFGETIEDAIEGLKVDETK